MYHVPDKLQLWEMCSKKEQVNLQMHTEVQCMHM